MITNHKLDALCLTGMCLKPDSYINLNESTPQGYYCEHESHPKCPLMENIHNSQDLL